MSNTSPQISVIMPAYNAATYLREAIDSVLAQTFTDFEFIIINDGSTDSTEEIILSYGGDPRIVYVKNQQNLKLIKSLNKGIDMARGRYIARMDSDDLCMPNRFEVQHRFMEENPSVGVCASLVYRLRRGETTKSRSFPMLGVSGCRFCAMLIAPFCHPSTLFRSEVVKRYKYSESTDSIHIEDFVLWGEFAIDNVQMSVVPQYLLQYRDNPTGISRTYTEVQRENHAKRVHFVVQKILGKGYCIDEIKNTYSKKALTIGDITNSLQMLDDIKAEYVSQNRLSSQDLKDVDFVLRASKQNLLRAKFKNSNFIMKILIALRYCTL